MTREDLSGLLDAYEAGTISEADARVLAAAIRRRDAEGEWLRGELAMRGRLNLAVREEDTRLFADRVVGILRQEQAGRIAAGAAAAPAAPARRWQPVLWATAVVLAAAAVAGFFLATSGPHAFATVREAGPGVVVLRDGSELAAQPGGHLRAGDLLRVPAGVSATLEIPGGGSIRLQGEAGLSIEPSSDVLLRLELASGLAEVEDCLYPLSTPQATVRQESGALRLTVGRGATLAEGLRGRTRLAARRGEAAAITIEAGASVLVDDQGRLERRNQ